MRRAHQFNGLCDMFLASPGDRELVGGGILPVLEAYRMHAREGGEG